MSDIVNGFVSGPIHIEAAGMSLRVQQRVPEIVTIREATTGVWVANAFSWDHQAGPLLYTNFLLRSRIGVDDRDVRGMAARQALRDAARRVYRPCCGRFAHGGGTYEVYAEGAHSRTYRAFRIDPGGPVFVLEFSNGHDPNDSERCTTVLKVAQSILGATTA